MAEVFPAFKPNAIENDVAEVRRRVKAALERAGVLVEFRPHRVTVERYASVTPGSGYAVSTVDVAEVTEIDSGAAHVVLFDTGDAYAVPNLVASLAQLRGRIDHGRWLWKTRATRTRSSGAVVTTLAVADEDQAAALALTERHQEWAVEHPSVTLVAHRSGWSVLYTLAHVPGGRIVTRHSPTEPWVPETACLCGEAKPESGHLTGCPEVDAPPPTIADVRRFPEFWVSGAGHAIASRTHCPHGYYLTDSCPGCDADQDQAAAGLPDCPGRAEVIRDVVTAQGGYLGSCDHCRWQGEIWDRRVDAQRDVTVHNAGTGGTR
ncbi:hypothetical protein ACWEFJ_28295 [Actinosynnema sp. NPDC004786]